MRAGTTGGDVRMSVLTRRVGEKGSSLQPQAGGVGVDASGDSVRQERIVPQNEGEGGAVERTTTQGQGGGEEALVALEHIESDSELISGRGVAELVVEFRGEER